MSDSQLRVLESSLAANPEDLETRIKLLSLYQRLGILNSKDLLDLAALKDPGAVAITGKTLSLESRSKRFYIRCAWVIADQIWKRINQEDFKRHTSQIVRNAYPDFDANSSYITRPRDHLLEYYDLSFDAITQFRQLIIPFLAGTLDPKTSVPVKIFSPGNKANLGEFFWIFNNLRAEILTTAYRLPEWALDEPGSIRTLQFLLGSLHKIAAAIRGETKRRTDESIDLAAQSKDSFENIDEPYYTEKAHKLLEDSIPLIIRNWLPKYTPSNLAV